MLGQHPSILIGQTSAYAQEMRKHEARHTQWGEPGRPYVYQEYPKQLYRAIFKAGEGITLTDSIRVETADEERNMCSRGFHPGPQAAHDAAAREQTEYGRLAAEREYDIQHSRLSPRAVAEVRAAEEAHGASHMPTVPVTPIKRRGRPRQAEAGA